jgi:hypothetical protein
MTTRWNGYHHFCDETEGGLGWDLNHSFSHLESEGTPSCRCICLTFKPILISKGLIWELSCGSSAVIRERAAAEWAMPAKNLNLCDANNKFHEHEKSEGSLLAGVASENLMGM